MGTCNWYIDNTDKYYVVEEDEWSIGGYGSMEDFRFGLYEFLKDNLKGENIEVDIETGNDGSRSHTAHYLATVTKTIQYKNFDFGIVFVVKLNSGYYEHGVLDYSIQLRLNGEVVADPEDDKWWDYEISQFDVVETMFNESEEEMSYGLCVMVTGKVLPKVERLTKELSIEIDKSFAKFTGSDGLGVVARFSNGETWYG